jgi:5-methylcytosine-specific restriction endonuclease McrBC GTP-binding regulatory subunit McrB
MTNWKQNNEASMNKFFILTTTSKSTRLSPTEKITLPTGDLQGVLEGDRVLLASDKGGVFEQVEPLLLIRGEENGKAVSLEVDRVCMNPVSMERVRSIINRALGAGSNEISAAEYEKIVESMGGVRLTEKELLEHVKNYIAARGYYFSDETIHNYHICLKTRPFVILAGLSGTGKSKLSQLYAEALGHTVQNNRYLRMAVRPSWNDDRFLLGYFNTLTGEYVTEPAVEFVIQAEKDRENLYFFCLDEMNLAHVEYYFSQFLSALEEENPADRRIHLYSQVIEQRLAEQKKSLDVDRIVLVPNNLLFTGTINVDETTQSLSDKVIDRANTIEFFDVDLGKVPAKQPIPDPIRVSASTWRSYSPGDPDLTFRPQIIEIGKILNKSSLGLGYRVLREIEMYLANSKNLLEPQVAFDLQIKQRILPRVRGTATIANTLHELLEFMRKNKFERSAYRVEEMEARLKRDGYTSFWR